MFQPEIRSTLCTLVSALTFRPAHLKNENKMNKYLVYVKTMNLIVKMESAKNWVSRA